MGMMLKLRHPNLVSLLHVITRDPPMAVVLEYLKGGDFSEWLKAQGPEARDEDLIFIVHQVGCGMAELARRGIGRLCWRGL
jgi:serine/threonine protein kinase